MSEEMGPFYQNIASFPTVVFTFFLGVTLLYWLVAVLGLIDIEVLDFDMPDAEGQLDINPDTGLSSPDVLAGLMLRFGLQGVPVTVIISFISLFGWLLSYYGAHFLLGFAPDGLPRFLLGIPVLAVALFLAVMLTAQVIKPLRRFFRKAQQQTVRHLLGQTAIVRTSRVDNDFGEATLEDGGAGLILKVRSAGSETFRKGDRVVLLEHRPEENVYRVISEDEFKGS
jgi:hypothetical protein